MLEGWVSNPNIERIGSIFIHTNDGEICRAEGEYPEGLAESIISSEVKRDPAGVRVSVADGFKYFPMSKVNHISFKRAHSSV